uniref:Venom carboxylesterase-6-like protein n=1 Tax=Triatoma infestans TaxID=30076 RepID=A0A170U2Q7_TRIIF
MDLRKVGNDNDKRKSMDMVKMWTNFAKGLDPLEGISDEQDWKSISKNGGYLEIDTDKYIFRNPKMEDRKTWMEKRLEFWTSLPYRLQH